MKQSPRRLLNRTLYTGRRFSQLRETRHSYHLVNSAAQLAYGVLLAFLPMTMLLNWFFSLLMHSSQGSNTLMRGLRVLLPNDLLLRMENALGNNIELGTASLMSVFGNVLLFFFVFYASVRAVRSFMVTSTKISGERETRNMLTLWSRALVNLLILLFSSVVLVFVYTLTQDMVRYVLNIVQTIIQIDWLLPLTLYFSYFYLGVATLVLLTWCFATFPARAYTFSQALPGSLTALAGWSLILFISKRGGVSLWPTTGAFYDDSVQIIFIIYCLCVVLLLGAVVNSRLRNKHEAAARKRIACPNRTPAKAAPNAAAPDTQTNSPQNMLTTTTTPQTKHPSERKHS